jgi:predicted NACHT family NTPase
MNIPEEMKKDLYDFLKKVVSKPIYMFTKPKLFEEHKRRTKRKHGTVDPFCPYTDKPPLEQVYIPQKIRKPYIPVSHIPEEERAKKQQIIDATDILEADRFVVLGEAGTGKTTLLNYFAIQHGRRKTRKSRKKIFNIFICLREYIESKKNLIGYVTGLFDVYKTPGASELLERELRAGRCLLLFDDLQAIPRKKRENFLNELKNMVEKYFENQYIITSKTSVFDERLLRNFKSNDFDFETGELLKFEEGGEGDIEAFIEKWLGAKGKNLYNILKSQPKLMELAANPLLITIIVTRHDDGRIILPYDRLELYDSYVKNIIGCSPNEISLLKKIAFYCKINRTACSANNLDTIHNEIEGGNELEGNSEDLRSLLDGIVYKDIILCKKPNDAYDFLYSSLQDYFTARYIYEEDQFESIIGRAFDQDWRCHPEWEEIVFLLVEMEENRGDEKVLRFILEKKGKKGKLEESAPELIEALGKDTVMKKLARISEDQDVEIERRTKAIELLGSFGKNDAFGYLNKAVEDRHKDIRKEAVKALSYIQELQTLNLLEKVIANDEGEFVRVEAIQAAGISSWSDDLDNLEMLKKLPELIKKARLDESERVRTAANFVNDKIYTMLKKRMDNENSPE